MLAELIVPTARTTTFAWYNFVGYLATALGSAEAGRLVDFLQLTQHWTPVESCRAVFVQYSIVGAALIAILVTGDACHCILVKDLLSRSHFCSR
jgi:MFS family permease